MSIFNFSRGVLVVIPAFIVLSGCKLMPEPTLTAEQLQQLQPIQDLRPQLLFSLDAAEQGAALDIYVNTLYMGTVADFHSANRPLRLLSGQHTIEIREQNEIRLQTTLELPNGAVRIMHIPVSAS
ncbi:hypothetical protein [Aliidiomarina quisquiliarum]|uniref:hypothetical protein n=1 Tax=Aliidiomarina quisquiliarum TaxID=2938947 RepID=UPI00208F390A|nr:hypothetical protein [Aliidiomarina quisquiliarum]MCO4320817.1 hypothetical protein [Aliidiomarina quisquiliarum]